MKTRLLATGALLLAAQATQAQTGTCTAPINHVSNFMSVLPSVQPDSIRIPATHTFQMLVQQGDPYSNPLLGNVKGLFDFTGYVPFTPGNSKKGWIDLNHEGGDQTTGGVSVLDVIFDEATRLWQVTQKSPVSFADAMGTGRNCSGGITPWRTSISSEETLPSGDANEDGYQDIGWQVEIDPATRSIIDYDGDGNPDKLWKMGRMSHENAVVAADSVTVYEANDENPGYIWKFVADEPGNLSEGKLYVLKLDGAIGTVSSGSWKEVPNSTPTECNNVRSAATALGATNFSSLEDVEISPLDGMVYFTSKSSSRVYRFRDFGETANQVEVFVGNPSEQYHLEYAHEGDTAEAYEQWRDGNDNLTFDDMGNLYVIQDGGRNHIWMVSPCHTMENPDVKLFMVTPAGSEPTGMTFSPDYKYMFVSIQHPDAENVTVMQDAAGEYVVFNRESAIVIAHNGYLGNTDSTVVEGPGEPTAIGNNASMQTGIARIFPNPATSVLNVVLESKKSETAYIRVYSMTGAIVMGQALQMQSGTTELPLNTANLAAGTYNLSITTAEGTTNTRFVKQ